VPTEKTKKKFNFNVGRDVEVIHAKISSERKRQAEALAYKLDTNLTQVVQIAIKELYDKLIGSDSH
jgi:hypothetical protein